VHRHELRPTLARLCRVLCKAPDLELKVLPEAAEALPAPAEAEPAAATSV